MSVAPGPLPDVLQPLTVRRPWWRARLRAALGSRSGGSRSPTTTTTPCPAGVADQLLQLILDQLAVLGADVDLVVVPVESELDILDALGLVLVQVTGHDDLYFLCH
jgi:hypothetical protein